MIEHNFINNWYNTSNFQRAWLIDIY